MSGSRIRVLLTCVRFGSLQVLIPLESKNTSEARAFTKEISTDGNVQTVADLDPRMFPAFYALAPDYMRLMLKPLLEYSLQWPAQFAFHDLGKSTCELSRGADVNRLPQCNGGDSGDRRSSFG